MSTYKTIFFDLDHTLWDFEQNSKEALTEIFINFKLESLGIPAFEEFLNVYYQINERMWDEYRKDLVTKDELRNNRFYESLRVFDIDNRSLANDVATAYVKSSPHKTNLFPHCHEILAYLKSKYDLHIITNGFDEVQHLKLKCCELTDYFGKVITSEKLGYKKPDSRIFQHAMDYTNAALSSSLMIGDGVETDILGAKNFGMDQVFFNPGKINIKTDPTYEITSLIQLREFL